MSGTARSTRQGSGAGVLSKLRHRPSLAAFRATAVIGAGTVVRFSTQVVLARWLGAAAFGTFVVARAWGEGLAVLPTRGYLLTVVQHLPEYRAKAQWPEFRGLLRVSRIETLLLSIAFTVVGVLVAWQLDASRAVILGLCLVPVVALISLQTTVLQAMNRYPSALAVRELVQPLALAGLVAVLLLSDRVSADTAIGAYLISSLLASLLLWRVLSRSLPAESRTARPRNLRREWVRSARPLYVSQLALGVLGIADLLIIGALLGPAPAGIFAAAGRIAFLSQIFETGAESVAAGPIAEAWARRDTAEVQRWVDQTIRLAAPPTILLMLLAIPFGGTVLGLLGPEFVAGRDVLLILLFAHVMTAFDGPVGFVVSMSGMHRTYARVMASHALAGVGLAFAAASVGGVELVAGSTALVIVSWNVWLATIAYRRLGIRCWPRWRYWMPAR